MNGPVVLIGSPIDGHVDAIKTGLADRGVEAFVLDSLAYPDSVSISLGEELAAITIDGRVIERPGAVYFRDMYTSPMSVGVDAVAEMDADWRRTLVAFREKGQVLLSVLARWCEMGVPAYNPTAPDWKQSKPFQLALLEKAGLPVPRTLWTNDPNAVRVFAAGGRVAYKPVAGGAATRELGPDDLTDERLETLRSAPVTFQELLGGENYRVYCLDGTIAESFRVTSEALDYRQNDEIIEKATLPDEVLQQCLKAAEVVGLRWTGIDLKRHSDGGLRFLELNPSPMFLGFDSRAGTNVLGRLVDALWSHAS